MPIEPEPIKPGNLSFKFKFVLVNLVGSRFMTL